MPKFTALQPIEHDRIRVEEGGTLDLTDDEAAPLLAIKHIAPYVKPSKAAKAAGDGSEAGGSDASA